MYNEFTLLYSWKYHDIVKNYTSKKKKKKNIETHAHVYKTRETEKYLYFPTRLHTTLTHNGKN